MEVAFLLLFINTIFLGGVILLKMNKLIGLLVTIYCFVWGITIYLLAIFSPNSLPFITLKGIAVIYGHFVCVLLAAVFTFNSYYQLLSFKGIPISSKYLYIGCLVVSGFGILMMLYTADVWSFYVQNQLAQLRGELFEQKIVVNKYYKLMGNIVYPLAIVGPVYFFRKNKNILILLAVVLLGALLSVSNGGKGNLLMIVILVAGSVLYMCTHEAYRLPTIIKRAAVILGVLILVFFYLIGLSRAESDNAFSWFDSVVLLNEYFSSSIPSLCQWMELDNVKWINFNIGQFSLLRELGAMVGISTTRVIDLQIVNIPHPFNVFTAFADSLAAFGYVGSLVYYLVIGAILGLVDIVHRKGNSVFLFATFFLFICYSLFTDIFFYMIGSWICLSFYYLFTTDEVSN
jgi:oligosaccharide repeat unit polymerase